MSAVVTCPDQLRHAARFAVGPGDASPVPVDPIPPEMADLAMSRRQCELKPDRKGQRGVHGPFALEFFEC